MYNILKGTTGTPIIFGPVISSTDHIADGTGLTLTVTISKNAGAFASPSGAVSEIANGFYKIAGNATDTNTAGPIAVKATGTGADPYGAIVCQVIDPTVAVYGANTVSIGGTAQTARDIGASVLLSSGTGAGQISLTSGLVTLANGAHGGAAATLQLGGAGGLTGAITGSLSGSVGSVTGAVGSVTAAITLPSIPAGWVTAAGIAAAALNGKGDWATINPTNLTAAQIATGVWQDTTAGDFTTIGSIGKSLFTSGNAPGAASGLALVGSNMGTVSSVTGAVGSVTGSVGSVTGAVGSVTAGVTLANGAHGGAAATIQLGGAGGLTGAVTGSLSGSVGSVTGAVGSVIANVNADVKKINSVTILGDGSVTPFHV